MKSDKEIKGFDDSSFVKGVLGWESGFGLVNGLSIET